MIQILPRGAYKAPRSNPVRDVMELRDSVKPNATFGGAESFIFCASASELATLRKQNFLSRFAGRWTFFLGSSQIIIPAHFLSGDRLCARDWIRTSTTFRMLPPEDSASTSFATRAGCKYIKTAMTSEQIRRQSSLLQYVSVILL